MTKGKQRTNNLYPKKKQNVLKKHKLEEKDKYRRSSWGKSNVVDGHINLEDDSTSTATSAAPGAGTGKREAAMLNLGSWGSVKKKEQHNISDSKKRSKAKKKWIL